MAEGNLLLMEQSFVITRLYVSLQLLCARISPASEILTGQDDLVNELATGFLRDSVETKAINRGMIEQWVSQVIRQQQS